MARQEPSAPIDEGTAPPDLDAPFAGRLWPLLAWLPGLALLGGLVWLVAAHLSEERELANLLLHADPVWLLAASLLQVLTYLSVAEAWRIPLAAAGHRPSRWRLARLAVLKLTLDQAVPTVGLSGTLFMVRRLQRSGVPRDVLGATMLIVLVGSYLAYAIAVGLALAVLEQYRDFSSIAAAVAATFAVLAAVLPLLLVWVAQRTPTRLPGRLRRLPWLRDLLSETAVVAPELLARKPLYVGTTAGSFATMVLDSATLAAMVAAVGATPDPAACFAALTMASVAASIGFVPGGLGTFESASVGVLTLTGSDVASALAATLLLRGFTFWLPMIPGVLLMRGSGLRRRGPVGTLP